MLRAVGDILPDQSDDVRFNLIQHKEEYYRKGLIDGCPRCKGTGSYSNKARTKTIRCGCKKSFQIILEMLKSDFPQQSLNILNEDLFDRKVVELDVHKDDNPTSKGESFKDSFLTAFLENKDYMVHNSCSSLFVGNNEAGKTYAALYMLADFIQYGYSGHYIRFKNYLNLLNSAYQNPEDKKMLRQIRAVKFLIVDELGKEHGKADYATCELEELIKSRQDNLSCTFLISNLDYSDFVKTYGNHVRSAFNKNFKVLVFHPDHNFRKRTRTIWPK